MESLMDGIRARQPRSRPHSRSKRTILVSFFAVLALLGASCGSSKTSARGTQAGSSDTASSPSGNTSSGVLTPGVPTPDDAFPSTEVVNLADGSDIKFNEALTGGTTPVLLWFYFPH